MNKNCGKLFKFGDTKVPTAKDVNRTAFLNVNRNDIIDLNIRNLYFKYGNTIFTLQYKFITEIISKANLATKAILQSWVVQSRVKLYHG